MYKLFFPFKFIKALRDGSLDNIRDVDYQFPYPATINPYEDILEKLQELGLLHVSESGKIATNNQLASLFRAFRVNLSQLASYTPDSVICEPLFGEPQSINPAADIFVLMPFSEDIKPVYEDHIHTVASKLNLSIARADDFFSAHSVITDIWNGINAAQLIVADCTHRNPNVFYEIGMAHTLGKTVICIAQQESDVPFDIRHLRYIKYEYNPRGMREFEETLSTTIESILHSRKILGLSDETLDKRIRSV